MEDALIFFGFCVLPLVALGGLVVLAVTRSKSRAALSSMATAELEPRIIRLERENLRLLQRVEQLERRLDGGEAPAALAAPSEAATRTEAPVAGATPETTPTPIPTATPTATPI